MPGSSGSGASTRSGGSGVAAQQAITGPLPPPGHPRVRELISASDIGELARRLAKAEGAA